tara:strand:- start:44 stop:193 length:150 start_codon:yes stop_codon:yes gene_type:complete
MRILIPLGNPIQISTYQSGSGAGLNYITSKQFDRKAKKLEKKIEKRSKT